MRKLPKGAEALLNECKADRGVVDLATWESGSAEILARRGLVSVVRRHPVYDHPLAIRFIQDSDQ